MKHRSYNLKLEKKVSFDKGYVLANERPRNH